MEDKEILQSDFMEESETTENKHAILKTETWVTKDERKNNCRKRPSFKGEPKTDTDLEVMEELVVNIKKQKERVSNS